MELFRFDRAKAARSITDPDGAVWPVNVHSDADELNGLVNAALEAGAIARPASRVCIYVYPMSLAEPDPVLAVDPGEGPALLGHALKLRERGGENPVDDSRGRRWKVEDVGEKDGFPTICGERYWDRPHDVEVVRGAGEAGKELHRYALVVVVEAPSPEAAWEAVQGTVGALEGDGEPDCLYIGAPWQGIPAEAEDLSTESLGLGMSVPDGDGGFLAARKELSPCE